jgi:hypothetical protein
MLQMDTQRKRWEALVAEARVEAQNEREAREEAEDCSRRCAFCAWVVCRLM